MQSIKLSDLAIPPYSDGAIIRNDHPGFREDYLAIHSLLKKYAPKNLMEIGTSSGAGTRIICNAMGVKKNWWNPSMFTNTLYITLGLKKALAESGPDRKKVFSIDVPVGTDPTVIYPGGEDGHPAIVGRKCYFPYTQLFSNSTTFDFSPYYPIESWFIDGKHDYIFAAADTVQALKSNPKLIIWHDIQIPEVEKAVLETMTPRADYDLCRIEGTRIAFALKKNLSYLNIPGI